MAPYKKHRYPGIRPAPQSGTFTIDFMDHSGRRRQVSYHGTESDAAKRRRDILSEVDKIKHGLRPTPEKRAAIPTLFELWIAFEKDRRLKIDAGSMNERTLERCQNSYNALIDFDPAFKARRLIDIKAADIEAYLVYRREMGFSAEGRNIDLRKFKTLFNFALKKGYLTTSPLAEVAPAHVPKADVRFLNEDELRSLDFAIEQVDGNDDFQRDARDLTLFLLFTGARLSEALYPAFDWSCDGQNVIQFKQTKGGKSRSIPKVETVKAVLESRKHIQGGPFPMDKNRAYKRVKWLLRKAGIANASPHTLRKSAGAWYYMATKDIFAASRFLGHSTVVVTEQHYSGLIQSLQVEYSLQFERALQANLQLTCNLEGNPGYGVPFEDLEETHGSRRKTKGSREWTLLDSNQ